MNFSTLEAKFAPNSYGFRPARSCHDAIEAIFTAINQKNAYVLDADIKGCFDNIDHTALLKKLDTFPKLRRVIKKWLRNGIKAGTPQGGVISPLLANIALHGLEYETKKALSSEFVKYLKNKRRYATSMRDAQRSLNVIIYAKEICSREEVIKQLNPIIRGWSNYYRSGVLNEVFSSMNNYVFQKLWKWATWRHPKKGLHWISENTSENMGITIGDSEQRMARC